MKQRKQPRKWTPFLLGAFLVLAALLVYFNGSHSGGVSKQSASKSLTPDSSQFACNQSFPGQAWPPSLFIIGVEKGGSSQLRWFLNQHPAVCFADKYKDYNADTPSPEQLDTAVDDFCLQCGGPGSQRIQYLGVRDRNYLVKGGAERVRRDHPDAKVIVLFREPLQRMYSHFRMDTCHHGRGKPDQFEKYIKSYEKDSRYIEQLLPWLVRFGSSALLILKSEDLFVHPIESMDKVQAFLDVPYMDYSPIASHVEHAGCPFQPLEQTLQRETMKSYLRKFNYLNSYLDTLWARHDATHSTPSWNYSQIWPNIVTQDELQIDPELFAYSNKMLIRMLGMLKKSRIHDA